MRKIILPLSIINTFLILIFLFVIIIPISYWSYQNFENTLHKSIVDYFKQTNNIVNTVIEQEAKTLNNITLNLSNYLNEINIEDVKQSDISQSISSEVEGIDLIFLKYNNKTVDFSTSLFDTSSIIKKYTNKDLYENQIVTVSIQGVYYSALLSTHNIINHTTGQVKGKITVGKFFNDNFTLVNYIKKKSNVNNISLIFDNQILTTSLAMDSFEYKLTKKLSMVLSEYEFFTQDNLIISKQIIEILDKKTDIYIITSINNNILKSLNDDFKKQILVLVIAFLVLAIIAYFAINAIVVKPSMKLLNFAQEVQKNGDSKYEEGIVGEYNNIAHGLKNIIGELRDVKEQYHLAIEGAQDGLWDWNIQTNEIYFSNIFKEILGYEKDENIDIPNFWQKNIHMDDVENAKNQITEHLKGLSGIYDNEYRFRCKDGSFKWMKSRGKALFDENKKAYRMVGFHTDIHHLKELEEENKAKQKLLYQKSKMASMGEMIGNIAHQWRQPLSTISTASTGIKMHKEFGILKDEDIITAMDVINNTVQHLSFRDFFNPHTSSCDFSIQDIIAKTINILTSQFKSKEIEIIEDVQDNTIHGLENELIQVLINIINNSRDALVETTNQKRLIFVNSYIKDQVILITIKDNAGGFKDDIINRVFEPYFTTKDKKVGTGIGLYMCEEIITRHMHGTIKAQNAVFDYEHVEYTGALFTIKLPFE